MSLTRDEWLKMWESVKAIELEADVMLLYEVPTAWRLDIIKLQTAFMKVKIQQVIGQME
jgi:hypothetical protein